MTSFWTVASMSTGNDAESSAVLASLLLSEALAFATGAGLDQFQEPDEKEAMGPGCQRRRSQQTDPMRVSRRGRTPMPPPPVTERDLIAVRNPIIAAIGTG